MTNNLNQQIESARRIFSKMPQDLFDSYIKNLILDLKDWPFKTSSDSANETSWERIFKVVSMSQMASCSWSLCQVQPTEKKIHSKSLRDIELLLKNYTGVLPRLPIGYDYDYCRASTRYHIELFQREKTFSIPIVLYPIDGKYYILDGNHRVAATFMVKHSDFEIPAWIAKV